MWCYVLLTGEFHQQPQSVITRATLDDGCKDRNRARGQMGWDEYPDVDNPRELVTSIMVGDLVRIRDYPAKGFQIQQDIPDEVWAAAERLIAAGCVEAEHLP